MDVLIVGGGLYGISIALRLADAGHDVTLEEKESALFLGASGANQWRLHRGYHYPRSEATARECKASEQRFRAVFPESVVDQDDHYYCIAREDTKTTPAEFLAHCDRLGLPYEYAEPPSVDRDAIDLCLRVPESRVDPDALRNTCLGRLRESAVDVETDCRVTPASFDDYDVTVVAAYAHLNELVATYADLRRPYRFQLVEKPVVSLPERFRDTSTVVMDGPFMCYDQLGRSDRFLLGNVVHSVHDRMVGSEPQFSSPCQEHLFEGLVPDPVQTNVDEFRRHGEAFLPGLGDADWHGSYFTIRTVEPDVEDTDARLTHVDRQDDVIAVLSGKLASCLDAADEVATELRRATPDSRASTRPVRGRRHDR